MSEFLDLRWICKTAVLQRWIMRSVRLQLSRHMKGSHVHSDGFRKRASASMVVSFVRQLLYLAKSWVMPLLVAWEELS